MHGRVLFARTHRWCRKPTSWVDLGYNVVTNLGLAQVIRMHGTGLAIYPINRMQFGSGGATEDETDETLQMPIAPIKNLSLVEAVDSRTVAMEAYLDTTEGNGFPLSEVGLLSVDGVLMARKTFTAQSKTSDYLFHFRWIVGF